MSVSKTHKERLQKAFWWIAFRLGLLGMLVGLVSSFLAGVERDNVMAGISVWSFSLAAGLLGAVLLTVVVAVLSPVGDPVE